MSQSTCLRLSGHISKLEKTPKPSKANWLLQPTVKDWAVSILKSEFLLPLSTSTRPRKRGPAQQNINFYIKPTITFTKRPNYSIKAIKKKKKTKTS